MTEEISRIIEKIREKPYLIKMGANKVAFILDTTVENFRTARMILRGMDVDIYSTVSTVIMGPKILLLDIEISPVLAAVWKTRVWEARISHESILSDWYMLTFSCKYLGSESMMSYKLTGEEALREDDSRLVDKLWSILDDTDIVICHNGDYFDIPCINSRFILSGLGPTSYYKQIDTLKVARKQFGFTHNSLDALAERFGIPAKIDTTFELWKRCIRGDEEALFEMESYNRHDVEILEGVYLKLRPWIKSHPNLALYDDSEEVRCPHCGSKKLELNGGFYTTHTGKYPTYRCLDCGATPRSRKSDLPKEKTKSLLVSIPGR
jgi:DNA-directed RNA polymerase subunit RPC12/RpoP